MDWAAWSDSPRCRACGTAAPRTAVQCPACNGVLSIVSVGGGPTGDQTDPSGAISFPKSETNPTPLVESDWLADESDARQVFVKDEGANPTGHWSDRGMRIAASLAAAEDIATIGLASPGRSGVAAAAAGATNDVDVAVHVPSRAPFPTKAMINVHGGDMTVVGGRYADARDAHESADGVDWSVDPMANPYVRAGFAQVYPEIVEQLAEPAPDVLVLPVGSSAAITAIGTVIQETVDENDAVTPPKLVAAQPAGCAPIAEAYLSDRQSLPSIDQPDTICGELEIPAPGGGPAAVDALGATGGEAVAVPDPAALEAAVRLADRTGLSASVAGGMAAAAATDLSIADPEDTVVVLNPGAGGLDADILRSHLMGQGI